MKEGDAPMDLSFMTVSEPNLVSPQPIVFMTNIFWGPEIDN